MKTAGIVLFALLAALVVWTLAAGSGSFGSHEGPGASVEARRPQAAVNASEAAVSEAAAGIGASRDKQIPLRRPARAHDHLLRRLHDEPARVGRGGQPSAGRRLRLRALLLGPRLLVDQRPRRERITPARSWRETNRIDAPVQRGRRRPGEPRPPSPSSAGSGPRWAPRREDHYGHKNVVLAHTDDARIRALVRSPHGASSSPGHRQPHSPARSCAPRPHDASAAGEPRYHDFSLFAAERAGLGQCSQRRREHARGETSRLHRQAPRHARRALRASSTTWGHDAIVIPHGTTWGFYTPSELRAGDKQLSAGEPRPRATDPVRDLLGPRQLRGVPRLAWRSCSSASGEALRAPSPSENYLPTLLARRRDRSRVAVWTRGAKLRLGVRVAAPRRRGNWMQQAARGQAHLTASRGY